MVAALDGVEFGSRSSPSRRARPEWIPKAIEEVLRYRAPLQWMYRVPTRAVELDGLFIVMVRSVIGGNRVDRAVDDAVHRRMDRRPLPET